jgi:hypothetical protein
VKRFRVTFVLVLVVAALHAQAPRGVQFVFTSDAHYGLTRPAFRGRSNVDSAVVNAALVNRINTLPSLAFPSDGGLRAGQRIGAFDFVAEAGDVTNREETLPPALAQSAATSWAQFESDYVRRLTVQGPDGRRASLFVVPGNHEASNAVGFYKAMAPAIDKTSMVAIYNQMMKPAIAKTTATFDYSRDKVFYSRDVGGLHFVFVQVWPDSRARAWMETDLKSVSDSTPVIVFAHDQPDVEAKHFINPNGRHDVNATDRFENLLADTFADGATIDASSETAQRALEAFLGHHRNITAYFHGNSNWNQFYDWVGPGRSVVLHTFRVDSPMKGDVSSRDERKLSFQVVTIDTASRLMTVRECLWNADPRHPDGPIEWGGSTTVALQPRPALHSTR